MSALMIVTNILLILIAIVLIVAVLLQQGQRQGLGAIGGGAETFFGKNKSKGYEGKLLLITKIGAAVFVVLAIVATLLTASTRVEDTADTAGDTQIENNVADEDTATEDGAADDAAAE